MRSADRESAPQRDGEWGAKDESMVVDQLLIGARQAANTLGISARTLWSLTKRGAVPSRKIGARTLYSTRELAEWIDMGCPSEAGAGRLDALQRQKGVSDERSHLD